MSEFLDVCALYPLYQGSSIVMQDIMVYYTMQPKLHSSDSWQSVDMSCQTKNWKVISIKFYFDDVSRG